MATVNLIKAAARPRAGKGAARAERRAGRVPGIIYGDGKPPLPISLDYAELRQRIYAGHFLTTIHDVEIDGVKHRVIPRDFQLDAVRDLPLHVDFMRLGEGATIRVNIPIHVRNADQSPGVKRGGTVSDRDPQRSKCAAAPTPFRAGIDVDVSELEINHSKHLSDITLPPKASASSPPRHHAGHGRAAVGLCGRNEGRRRSCRCRRRCCCCCRRRGAAGRRRRSRSGSRRCARRRAAVPPPCAPLAGAAQKQVRRKNR